MAKSLGKLHSDELKARHDYLASAKTAMRQGKPRLARTYRHISREEHHHAQELASLSSLRGKP